MVSLTFSDAGISEPPLVFDCGVAAVDILTLNRAAHAVVERGVLIQVPVVADVVMPPVFDELCEIKVDEGPPLRVTATIGTQKMTWAYDDDSDVFREDFVDYSGVGKRGVHLTDCPVAAPGGVVTTHVPTRLDDGRELRMWFAEVPREQLESVSHFGLFRLAGSITREFAASSPRQYDWVVVPAQQIKYERDLDELLPVNAPQIEQLTQRAFIALDETGVRVKAVTEIFVTGLPVFAAMEHHVFGAHHPVVIWLTEPDSVIPFAVVATTSDAWLEPESDVSFDDAVFS